ncbi:MAG: Uncharacterized protein FD166_1040 [Bacteroidetes bacterium]|nr:MAG: Uncharacterized protein FD166_1040 [Bacteroidota bacterium]
MKKLLFFALLFVVFISSSLHAQDIIMKKDNELIKCKIKEIGLDEIKYMMPEYSQEVVFTVDKDDLVKIIFENGKEMEFQVKMTNPETYTDNKKNILKIDFLSPLTGNTTIAYERSLRPGRSIEANLGIIGLGIDAGDRNAGGAFVKFGYKFIKDPDFYLRGMRYAHILKGGYIKPEVAFGFFSREEWNYDIYYNNVNEREDVLSGTIQLVFGKQWIFDNTFAIDMYGGVGYGFTTSDNDIAYHYGYTIAGTDFPLAFSTGLKIGWLFR